MTHDVSPRSRKINRRPMTGDDSRHGTHAGYVAGCRDDCCRRAMNRYNLRRRLYALEHGHGYAVPAWRATRRLQALRCMGWSTVAIADYLGIRFQVIQFIDNQQTVTRARFEEIDRAFRELAMKPAPRSTPSERMSVAKTVAHATRKGWAPPLAWDDIDDPTEQPSRRRDRHGSGPRELDEVVVQRIIDGEHRLRATHAEKVAVVRRWETEHHGSLHELERLTGWNISRYLPAARAVPDEEQAA